jgi:hypothetical protein
VIRIPEQNRRPDIAFEQHSNRWFMIDHSGASRSQRGREAERVIPATAARQGVTGHNVRYVLVISMLGAIVALVIVYLVTFS